MKLILILIVILPLFLVLGGCSGSTTSLLNPSSDLHVIQATPSTAEVTAVLEDSGAFKNITFQPVRFDFAINNGVSAFIESVEIHYYDPFGQEIVSPLLAQNFPVSLYVAAPSLELTGAGTGTSTGSSSSSSDSGSSSSNAKIMLAAQEQLSGTAGFLNLSVINNAVYTYIHGSAGTDDDVSPIQVRVVFGGHDINGNTISFSGSCRLDNLITIEKN